MSSTHPTSGTVACGCPLTADFRRLYRASDTHLYSQCQSEYQVERLKALPFHSTPQAISCSSRFHGNPAFLFAIWPSSMRFASQNSGCTRTSRTSIVHQLRGLELLIYIVTSRLNTLFLRRRMERQWADIWIKDSCCRGSRSLAAITTVSLLQRILMEICAIADIVTTD